MMGMTGSRLVTKGTAGVHYAPQNLLGVMFPHKTVVTSQQMVDSLGRPTYRKDIKV
jgi:hypothetical protein